MKMNRIVYVVLLMTALVTCNEREEYTFGLRIRTIRNQYAPSEAVTFSVYSADGGAYVVSKCDDGHLGISVMKKSYSGWDGYYNAPCRHDSIQSMVVVFPDSVEDSVSFSAEPGVYFLSLETGMMEVGEGILPSNEFTIE